jgi:hypothetical protein
MGELEQNYKDAAYEMQNAYLQTSDQNSAVEMVQSSFNKVSTDTLVAMWKAIDAYVDMNEA